VIDPEVINNADFDALIDQVLSGEFPIPGGMLSIERTRAMTMIDIDGSGDALAINRAAAMEIPRLLRLLDIGGQIGVDFLGLRDKAERQQLDAVLAESCAALGPHERTAVNGFGFLQIVRPRSRPSIPEILCGTTPGRLSLESRAVALLRDAGRSVGHGKRQLVAPPAIVDLIRQWPEETEALRYSFGVAIELVPDSAAIGYGHVHVSQS
jgi:ribonuclease G